MSNQFYNATGNPIVESRGLSQLMRTEFAAIATGFETLKGYFAGFTAAVFVGGTDAAGATVNDYVITVTPAPTAYSTPMILAFKATHTNTLAATVKINALAAKPLVSVDGDPLAAGDIESGSVVMAYYDGTQFLLISANDRACRNGEVYTGTHNYAGATVALGPATGVTVAYPASSPLSIATSGHVQDALVTYSQGRAGSSVTSLTIGLVTHALTASTGRTWVTGDSVRLMYDGNNFMVGVVGSYDSTTGAMSFTATDVTGTGTYAVWSIAPDDSATTQDVESLNYFLID